MSRRHGETTSVDRLTIEQYERDVQRQLAWSAYGAHMRHEEHGLELTRLEQAVAKANTRSDREKARRKLQEYKTGVRRAATTLVVGGGGGCSDPEDFD